MSWLYKGNNEEGIETKVKSRSDGWERLGKDSSLHMSEGNLALLFIYKYLLYNRVSTKHKYDILTFKPRASNSWLVN